MKEPSYPEGDLLDITAAAEYISVSTKTIRRYIQGGKLRARKVRNVWFLSRSELDKLVERDKPAPVAAAQIPAFVPAFDPSLAEDIKKSLDSFNERLAGAEGIKAALNNFNERLEEFDKRLYLLSQERENQHVRPDLIEKEQEIEFLKTDNLKLIEELARIKKEIADLKQNGPKDTMILKNKVEENESLKSTVASNERGLSLLRSEVEQRDLLIKKKDQAIQELSVRVRQLEEQPSKKSAIKTGLWGSRRPLPPYPYRDAGSQE
ncbi:MAG: helix-turn-helix domain-containing protein [bacterium]